MVSKLSFTKHIIVLVWCYLYFIKAVLAGPEDVAKAKCEEYAKAVYANEDSPVLTRNPGTNKVSQCGILEVPLIIGGVEVKPREFPHMAAIGYGQSPSGPLAWHCGGTLISDKFILTAAHCAESGDKGPAQKVRLGEIDFKQDGESDIQERNIARIITHPDYKPPSKYNDVALLMMDSPVKFDGFVRPACLGVDKSVPARGIATGFGKLSYDAEEGSSKLMKVTVTFMDNNACATTYKSEISKGTMANGITDSVVCAGEMNGGKDTCQGDSGGPIQTVLHKPECMYSIIGVTSFGKFCGFKNSPAIYTRVAHFIPWIVSNVWG